MENMNDILSMANYNMQTRKKTKTSNLGEIQNSLVTVALKLNLTEDQYEQIGSFVVTEPKVLEDDGISYESVKSSKAYVEAINNKIQSYRLEEQEISRMK